MKPQLTVEITTDAKVSVKVGCMKGKACKDFSKKLEEALGTTTKSVPTSEMAEVPRVEHRHTAGR